MKILKEYVKQNYLAPLLVCQKELEEKPLVFRGQPHVNFIVTFNEYLSFIENTQGIKDYLLSNSFGDTKQLLRKYRQCGSETYLNAMYKAFVLDMASAVGKEVWFSDTSSVVGTWITHTIPSASSYSKITIDTIVKNIEPSADRILRSWLSAKGYACDNLKISDKNIHLWNYALVLLHSGLRTSQPWSYII